MSFGLRYFAELRSKHKGVFWRVEIAERDYTGKADEMAFVGGKPLTITWERRGDDFFVPVKGSETTIQVLCENNFQYINLFTSDPRRFRVSIYRNTKMYWRGFVVADLYSERFTAPPYEVSVKAVDGFKLLSNIPFRNLDGTNITGRKSLWELVAMCLDLLELEIDVADWMDLYAPNMNLQTSPLRQTYIDMERFDLVYDDPTFRDVLELCLRPFGGQIFQSNGALHIRRAVSLYQATRPVSFYHIGAEFPSGWLVTADGKRIITATGDPIVTESTRERIESVWNNDINISGESVLDIVPALQKVSVQLKNQPIADLIPLVGFYNLGKWYDAYNWLSLKDSKTLIIEGDSANLNKTTQCSFGWFYKCTYIFKLEFTLRGYYRRWSYSTTNRPGAEHTNKFTWGIRQQADVNYWLQDDGQWTTNECWFTDEVKTPDEVSRKIEIQGMPGNGPLQFHIKMTLEGKVESSGRAGFLETCYIENMTLTVDTGNLYENSLTNTTFLNPANNADLNIPLPIADLPLLPNDSLIYSLYFTNSAGTPTRVWRTKGRNDYNTLIGHLVQCALKYKQMPSRRIGGELFSGQHIDLNSVFQDDKFLFAGFYVNSLELIALEDIFNTELVEMPGLLNSPTPPAGDDCILAAQFPANVKTVFRVENQIIAHLNDNRVCSYDTASGLIKQLYKTTTTGKVFPADKAFAVLEGRKITVIDYRGVCIKIYTVPGTNTVCFGSYLDGYILVGYYRPASGNASEQVWFERPEYIYQPSGSTYGNSESRGNGSGSSRGSVTTTSARLNGKFKSIVTAFCSLAFSTDKQCALFDRRLTHYLACEVFNAVSSFVTLSDFFFGINEGNNFQIYTRRSVSSWLLARTITGNVDFADHTPGEMAYSQYSKISIWTHATGYIRTVKNTAGAGITLSGLCYINGELYIIRGRNIYKYIQ